VSLIRRWRAWWVALVLVCSVFPCAAFDLERRRRPAIARLGRRMRRQYRSRLVPPIEFGFRNPETNDFCAPNAKQEVAIASTAEQIFYGGAVGGGKTVWLVVVAIMTCLMHSGVHVAIFRRTTRS
jgi:hypothetical protein